MLGQSSLIMKIPLPSRILLSARGAVLISFSRTIVPLLSRDPGGLVTSSKFSPGCLMPLITTGTLNSSCTLNSFMS